MTNKNPLSKFFVGSSHYSPFHDPADWERDFTRMLHLDTYHLNMEEDDLPKPIR